MSDITVPGASLIALVTTLAGVISWLFKLAYGSLKEDRDFWRTAYQVKEEAEWKQLQLMSDGIAAMRLLLEQRLQERG